MQDTTIKKLETNGPKKVIIVLGQEYEIPANLTQAEEEEVVEHIMASDGKEFLQKEIDERSRRLKETRGRKPKQIPLTKEDEEALHLQRERLTAPLNLCVPSKELLEEWMEDDEDE